MSLKFETGLTTKEMDTLKALPPDRQTLYPLPARHERFAMLTAFSIKPRLECYAEANDIALLDPREAGDEACRDQRKQLSAEAHDWFKLTTVRLRIAELRKPIVRKLARKFEYTLQKALEQSEVAHSLAYENGDVTGMLKAIELQSKLSRLLVDEVNVNHRFGVLDDTATAVLLAMRDEIAKKRARAKQLTGPIVEGELVVDHTRPIM